MNVLAVGAHPDDLEIGCAGTLARMKQQGHEIAMCVMTNGDLGHKVIPPEELSRIRAAEAQASAAQLEAEFFIMGYNDLRVPDSEEPIARLTEVIRQVQPDFIITHPQGDYMREHSLVGELVFEASFRATVPHLYQHLTPTEEVVPIYEMESIGGVGFLPEHYVDISAVLERKLSMLREHRSQVQWLLEHDKIDVCEMVASLARLRGIQCGVQYAEGFRERRAYMRGRPARLLP